MLSVYVMDDVSVEKAVKIELKLIEELQKIRTFIRRRSVNSDDSDDESDSDDEPLLTKLKESWSKFKDIERAKEIAEKQEKKLRQHQEKLKKEYYSNTDAQRLMKDILKRRINASEQYNKKKMADQLNRITHLKTREKNPSDQADVETFKKRLDAMREKLEQKRSGGKSHQRTARRNARRQKANALSKEEDPTDKELEERKNILRHFIEEVRRRDSEGNHSEMGTQLKL